MEFPLEILQAVERQLRRMSEDQADGVTELLREAADDVSHATLTISRAIAEHEDHEP